MGEEGAKLGKKKRNLLFLKSLYNVHVVFHDFPLCALRTQMYETSRELETENGTP